MKQFQNRLQFWTTVLVVLIVCIILSFVILHFCVSAYPFVVSFWLFGMVLAVPGFLTVAGCRTFWRTLCCYRYGTRYEGTCTGKRYEAREKLYVVEWETAEGRQKDDFTAGVGMFANPPFPVTVYEWGEERCLGKRAVAEAGLFALVMLLVQAGVTIPVILFLHAFCSTGSIGAM